MKFLGLFLCVLSVASTHDTLLNGECSFFPMQLIDEDVSRFAHCAHCAAGKVFKPSVLNGSVFREWRDSSFYRV